MTADGCDEMQLLVQADHDGELDAEAAARVAVHLRDCAACTAQAAALRRLSRQLRALPVDALPLRVQAEAARLGGARAVSRWDRWRQQAPGFGAGMALAAGVALALLPGRTAEFAGEAVSAHIRALQPGHLMDVVSTDRHTVKPWFDGRLDYAPPVQDFAGVGFALNGGRLDYVGGRRVAVLVYGRAKHLIDVMIWPAAPAAGRESTIDGYNTIRWSRDGMVFWAVSDLNMTELREFAALWNTVTSVH